MPRKKIDVTDLREFLDHDERHLCFAITHVDGLFWWIFHAISERLTVTVNSGRRDRQEVVFWNEKTVHLLVFYPCKKSTFLSFRQEVVFWQKKTLHLLVFYSCKKTTISPRSTVNAN